jgi:hypothetical protein
VCPPADPASSFFVPLGNGRWLATEHTSGPWDARSQHGGPPSALLAREIELCAPRDDVMVARVTVEILGAIPVAELDVSARLLRDGRSVQLVEASMSYVGRDVARATGWRVRRTEGVSIPPRHRMPAPLPGQDVEWVPPGSWACGYLEALEWRPVAGRFDALGPGATWSRLRYPLVPDEQPTGLQRVMAVADCGNGLSSELEFGQWWFINPELTVHLHRTAVGEWVCLDAETTVTDWGVGLATSVLSDQDGPLGVGAQSLLVAPR